MRGNFIFYGVWKGLKKIPYLWFLFLKILIPFLHKQLIGINPQSSGKVLDFFKGRNPSSRFNFPKQ